MSDEIRSMRFIHSVGTSEAPDGSIKVILSRLEPGSNDDDFEAQFRIEYTGGVEYFGLPGKWVTSPKRYVIMDLGRGNNVDRIIQMRGALSSQESDINFLREVARAITGMFVVNIGLMYSTTYVVAIPSAMAITRGWSGLPAAPHPFDGHCELDSVFVQEDQFDDIGEDE